MSEEAQITFYQASDVGKVRDHNEDSVLVDDPVDPDKKRKGRLFIVADGMGGYQAGEVASHLAVETVRREYYADPSEDPTARLRNAVQAANGEVQRSAQSNSARTGMGTTLVATALLGRKAYIASVGDSRAYVVHQGQISQITQDHSFVAEQVRAGLLTKEQARMHPQRNVITRALGSQPTIQVDTFVGDLSDEDVLLMCSDGLTGHVTDEHIRDTLMRLPPDRAARQLIQMAKDDGGTDNISVIILRMGSQPAEEPTVPVHLPDDSITPPSGTPIPGVLQAAGIEGQPTLPGPKARAGLPVPSAADRPAKRGLNLAWIAIGLVILLIALGVLAAFALNATGVLGAGGLRKITPSPTASSTAVPTVLPLQVTAGLPGLPSILPTVTETPAPSSTKSSGVSEGGAEQKPMASPTATP